MDGLSNQIREAIKPYGYQARTVSIVHLPEIQNAVGRLVRQGSIDRRISQTWHFFMKTNDSLPEAKIIIVVAMPQPFTRLKFKWQRKTFLADIPPTYFTRADDSRAEKILKEILEPAGYRIVKAHLALKTLAVRSGMAEYGKNNISYISGMGSLYQLVAFYSDYPGEEENWQGPRVMDVCTDCTLCRQVCPNGCITAGRFLIHAEKCLGFLSEREPDIPHWAKYQPEWSNALIGCMLCQFVCPVNKPYLHKVTDGLSFSEAETSAILENTPWEGLSPGTRKKLDDIRLAYPMMPRNLEELIKKQQTDPSTGLIKRKI